MPVYVPVHDARGGWYVKSGPGTTASRFHADLRGGIDRLGPTTGTLSVIEEGKK